MKKNYSIQLDDEFADKLQKLADRLEIPRSQLMRNLLQNGYDEAIYLEKLGVVYVSKKIRSLKEDFFDKIFSQNKKK
jgi:predicted DNA-binding protein